MNAVVIAVIGSASIYMLFGWLASAIIAAYLSERKGYGERPGLALGLLLPVVSVIVWVLMPAKAESDWKVIGPFGRQSSTDAPVDPAAGREPVGGAGPTGTAG